MSAEMKFSPLTQRAPRPGLALRITQACGEAKTLRFTHVFREELYGVWVTTPENARYARRPVAIPWDRYATWAGQPQSSLGRLSLPPELTRPLTSLEQAALDSQWEEIKPLVELFEVRGNLHRTNFSALINSRAATLGRHFNCVLRALLRYYYFGRDPRGLLILPPGTEPETNGYDQADLPVRRGRKSAALEGKYGPNGFVVGQADIADMVEALAAALREGPTYVPDAFEEHYLKKRFARRHPGVYKRLLAEEIPPPVTVRQFRYYTQLHELRISADLLENKKGSRRASSRPSVLRAFGPGSVYEIDATGGRVVMATAGDNPKEIGTPWIYLVIDRWSRYVLAVYITLRSPSFAEVRHALLAMLTSRARYRLIGCNVSDEEWPHGGPPAALCCDRGAEFLSDAFELTVAEKLLIPMDVLPPLTPDGKAIVERAIQTLKKRLSTKVKRSGGYMVRPTSSPRASKAFKNARKLAVHSLSEIYRALIDAVCDYNNRPHTTLLTYPELAAHGIRPTPKDAFVFGQHQISGVDSGSMSAEDFLILLLDEDGAEGVNHCIRSQGEMYEPADQLAKRLAAGWRKQPVALKVRRDELAREIRAWTGRRWATFRLKSGALAQSGTFTPEEQKILRELAGTAAVVCGHESLVRRLQVGGMPAPRKSKAAVVPRREKQALRSHETAAMNLRLSSRATSARLAAAKAERTTNSNEQFRRMDEDELERQLDAIRDHRERK